MNTLEQWIKSGEKFQIQRDSVLVLIDKDFKINQIQLIYNFLIDRKRYS